MQSRSSLVLKGLSFLNGKEIMKNQVRTKYSDSLIRHYENPLNVGMFINNIIR